MCSAWVNRPHAEGEKSDGRVPERSNGALSRPHHPGPAHDPGAWISGAGSATAQPPVTSSTLVGERLAIYLNDHLAGATAGLELARRLRASNEDDRTFGPALAEICAEIEADREALEAVMDRLGVGQSKLKPAAAVLGERLGRLKLNGQLRGYSPLSRLDELELLQVGVAGKRRLWRALEHTHAEDLADFELDALAERATGQLRQLEALHLKAATLAL
jgi:hypothetical protein